MSEILREQILSLTREQAERNLLRNCRADMARRRARARERRWQEEELHQAWQRRREKREY